MLTGLFKDASFGSLLNLHMCISFYGSLSIWTVLGKEILAHIKFLFFCKFSRVYRCAKLAFLVWGSKSMLTGLFKNVRFGP